MKEIGGKIVVKMLEELGVKYVFGVPGGQTLSVTDAIIDSNIEFIHTRHEGGAAAAADCYGRITGEPGVCLATTGPGATNLITGIGGAYRDSSPLIALLFQNKLPDTGKCDAQECDHAAIFSSIVKSVISVKNAQTIPWALREAYRVATTGKPGPVVVDLYRDVVEEQQAEYKNVLRDSYKIDANFCPTEVEIEKAANVIANSKKICIWAGQGVKMAKAGDEVLKLAMMIGAPIVTTYNALGVFAGDHENVFGPRSRHGSALTRRVLEEADCVIVLGSSLSAVTTNRWSIKLNNIIQIDISAENIGRHYPVSIGLIGEIKKTLDQLLAVISAKGFIADTGFLKEMQAYRAKWKKEVLTGPIVDENATPVPPLAVIQQLERQIKENSVIACDAGNPGAWLHIISMPKGIEFMKPVNYGNMGFALPGAIAGKLACPDREVIAILGDGSLGMTLAELETAAREKLPIIILLLNDSAYGNIKQEELWKTKQQRYVGVDFINVNYIEVAKALGCDGVIVNKAKDIPAAFARARESTKPFMIEIKLNGSFSVWPEVF